MSKADTMLSILWLLRSGRKLTARQLADELEIHIRTVYRCIDSLCASGAPIIAESGPNGGYKLLGQFAEAPLMFDESEQKALVQASLFAEAAGYPFSDELRRAVEKLKRYTNEKQLELLTRHAQGLSVVSPPSDSRLAPLLQQLEEACANVMTVAMRYDSAKDSPTNREFDPYAILHWKGSWYTVGFCRLRQAIRSFRVDRIASLSVTGGRFARPQGFSAEQYLLESLMPGSLQAEQMTDVRLKAPERALNELLKHWLFGHAVVERAGEDALFRIGASALQTYVPYFLLPYGRALTIIEPQSLIARMAEVSAALAEHYNAMRAGASHTKG